MRFRRLAAVSAALAVVLSLMLPPAAATAAPPVADMYGTLTSSVVSGSLQKPEGSPASGVKVIAVPMYGDSHSMVLGEATTGTDGRFELDVRTSRKYSVHVVPADGYSVATVAAAGVHAGISVELAKKCRALMVKAHPSILFGPTGTAAAQRAYFEECVQRNGNMPEAEHGTSGQAK